MSQTQVFEKGTKLNIDSLPLYDLKKGKDSLLSLKGIRLLNFWASWCKPCLDEMKSLEKLQKIYPEIDIDLLSFEDTVSQKKAILTNNILLPTFFIKDTTVIKIPEVLPRTIILKNDVVIRDMYTARDWTSNEIRNILDTLANNNY